MTFFEAFDLVQLEIIKRVALGPLYPFRELVTGNKIRKLMPVFYHHLLPERALMRHWHAR